MEKIGGLTSAEVKKKLATIGLNEITPPPKNILKKILLKLLSPIALMLLAASITSLVIHNVFDFYFILALFFLNFFIEIWQENKADNAIQKLTAALSVNVKVLRDYKREVIDSKQIVPGDIVELLVGDLIPADIKILGSKNLSINESILTGESLPKEKDVNDIAYSGSFVATGFLTGKVTATGANTFFNKEILSIEKSKKQSLLEKDILTISKFLMIISLVCIVILTGVFLYDHKPVGELIILDLSLFIAGIPVALPVVMSLIISIGVLDLSKKNVIVRRLSSLEDLSNVQILLTDKTGTMTQNEIHVENIIVYKNYTADELLSYVAAMAYKDNKNAINQAIIKKYDDLLKGKEKPVLVDFVPADSIRKLASSVIHFGGKDVTVCIGAPQMILKLCKVGQKEAKSFDSDVQVAASQGYRSLAVSIGQGENNMDLVGILLLSDPPLPDAKGVIAFLEENGIDVKMLTGDNGLIAARIAEQIGLKGIITTRDQIKALDKDDLTNIAGFAEILPKDKYDLVQYYQKNYVVAVTGDGINDLPGMESANVGIAVHNGADALKSSADMVLLSDGIEVIKDAIIESRKIFARLYTYSVYRLSESFRLILSILILGIVVGDFPLTALQLILIAFMNDIPILSLAFNRVKLESKVNHIDTKGRFVLSSLFGMVGVLNSLLLYMVASKILNLDIATIQTMFFLKLMVSGHLLIFVAHTKEKWYKFLPNKYVIWATVSTQVVATILAFTGLFMSASLSPWLIGFVWIWAFFWMQISDYTKGIQQWFVAKK